MTVKELAEKMLNELNHDAEITPYVYDYEYDSDDPEELGKGKIIDFEAGYSNNYYMNIGIHKR